MSIMFDNLQDECFSHVISLQKDAKMKKKEHKSKKNGKTFGGLQNK